MEPGQPSDQPKDLFPVFVFALALFAGGVGGYFVTGVLAPEANFGRLLGALLPPVGIVIGLALAEGVDGPLALLRLFSVLDGRHTFAEVLALNGKPRTSIIVFPLMMIVGTTAACAAGAIPIHMFAKPEMNTALFASYMGVAGAVYGVVMALLLRFLTYDEDAP